MTKSMIEIKGFEEVGRNLEMIGDKVRKKIIRRALRAGAAPIRSEIEKRAQKADTGPTYPNLGHAADFIGVTTSVRKTGETCAKIGPDNAHWWLNFIEYGTPYSVAQPFMRKGLDAAKNAALAAFEDELWRGIKEELRLHGIG